MKIYEIDEIDIAREIAFDLEVANRRGIDFGDMSFEELCKYCGELHGYKLEQIDLGLVEEELSELKKLRAFE